MTEQTQRAEDGDLTIAMDPRDIGWNSCPSIILDHATGE